MRRERQVRYEHLIDRFCLEHALTMLCAYDAVALDARAVAEVACVHALAHGDLSPFQIHATSGADAALAGEVDVFCANQLEQALQRIGVGACGGKVVIDAADSSSSTSVGYPRWIGTQSPPRPRWCCGRHRPS